MIEEGLLPSIDPPPAAPDDATTAVLEKRGTSPGSLRIRYIKYTEKYFVRFKQVIQQSWHSPDDFVVDCIVDRADHNGQGCGCGCTEGVEGDAECDGR
jgi:hypothetical protein